MTESARSARLFVALPVPRAASETLLKMCPPPSVSVRPVAQADLHITLHFLGNSDIDAVRRALETVTARSFSCRLDQTGCFSLRGGKKALWVGVEPVAELIALHRQTAAALKAVGFDAESRPYRPHVTIARLRADAPAGIAAEFVESSLPGGPIEIECARFALFASDTRPEGASYRILESYPGENPRFRHGIA